MPRAEYAFRLDGRKKVKLARFGPRIKAMRAEAERKGLARPTHNCD